MNDRTRQSDELQKKQTLWEQQIRKGSQRLTGLPVEERHRERLLTEGAAALSDLELMVILLSSVTRSGDVYATAARILKDLDPTDHRPDVKELLKVPGVGPAKAAIVAAAMELTRRRIHPRGFRISWPTDVLAYIRHVAVHKQERLISISLTGANEVLAIRTVTIGLVDRVHIHPREVFADPITDRAASVIIAHNHPSGDVRPGEDDKKATRDLQSAGKLLGIQLLDHLIFTDKDHYSFLENGQL